MSLLLLEGGLTDLGVSKKAYNCAVFLDALEFAVNGSPLVLRVALRIFSEGLFLALIPILVEPSLNFVTQVLGPDCGQRAETSRSLNVSNEADSNQL